MEAATSLAIDLAALPQVSASPELTATILARIARTEQRPPAAAATMATTWAWAATLAGSVALVAIQSTAGAGAAIDIVSPRIGGLTGPLVAMPSTATAALVLAGGLALYAAALFAPLIGRSRS